MGSIVLNGVRKSFGLTEIIKDVNLEIDDGPSWCSSGRPAAASRPCCG